MELQNDIDRHTNRSQRVFGAFAVLAWVFSFTIVNGLSRKFVATIICWQHGDTSFTGDCQGIDHAQLLRAEASTTLGVLLVCFAATFALRTQWVKNARAFEIQHQSAPDYLWGIDHFRLHFPGSEMLTKHSYNFLLTAVLVSSANSLLWSKPDAICTMHGGGLLHIPCSPYARQLANPVTFVLLWIVVTLLAKYFRRGDAEKERVRIAAVEALPEPSPTVLDLYSNGQYVLALRAYHLEVPGVSLALIRSRLQRYRI